MRKYLKLIDRYLTQKLFRPAGFETLRQAKHEYEIYERVVAQLVGVA